MSEIRTGFINPIPASQVRLDAILEDERAKSRRDIARHGGLASARKSTPEQRTARARKAGRARWASMSPDQQAEHVQRMVAGRKNRKP